MFDASTLSLRFLTAVPLIKTRDILTELDDFQEDNHQFLYFIIFLNYFIPEARDEYKEANEMVKAQMEITEKVKLEKARLEEGNL